VSRTILPQETGQGGLSSITWYLIAFNQGGSSTSVLPGSVISALFDGKGRVSGSTGCNQYYAPYQATLNNLKIGTPTITKMNCPSPPGTMSQETAYLTTMQGATTFSIDNDILTIKDSNGRSILTYSKVPPGVLTPAPFTGTMWYLNSFIDVKGRIWTPGITNPISLEFDSDGRLTGNGGCSNYSGTYTTSGITLAISAPLATTPAPCPDVIIQELETTYLTALPLMKGYTVSGNQLTLSDGTGQITMIYDLSPW